MSTRLLQTALLAAALASSGALAAEQAGSGSILSTRFKGEATAYLGWEQRETVNALLGEKVAPAQGRAGVQPVLAWCDAKVSNEKVTYVSVTDEAQAKEFRDTHPHASEVVLIDTACPMAYKAMAYWAVEDHDFEGALPWLEKAIAFAPLFDEAYTERGFVLNQLHRASEGVASYRQALAILERYPQPESKAVALRGLGFSLVELGDLKAARKAYEDSLLATPGNPTALSELEYLDGLEKAKQ